MIKAPLSHVKKNLRGGVIHRVLRELRDFVLRAAPPRVRALG
jgi:hypothetical protein